MTGPLARILARPRPVLLDGAVGTELARRGVPSGLPLWSAHAFQDSRWVSVLRGIHEDYACAGAEILVTNTFRTTRRALERAERGGDWRTFNEIAVVSENRVTRVGDDLPFEEAALLGCAVTTGLGVVANDAAGPGRTLADRPHPQLLSCGRECPAGDRGKSL